MNSRPMILRFCSGSVTPASAARNTGAASTTFRSTPVAATKSFSTCSASPVRSSPWSTKTQVSWWPMARWTSAAATAESTPPDRPQMAWAEPTRARMRSVCSSMTPRMVQVGAQPAAARNRRSTACRARCAGPRGGTAPRTGPGRRPRRRPPGVAGGPRGHREAGRRDRAGVPVGHPHLLAGGQPVEQRRRRLDDLGRVVAPYSPPPVRATSPPRPAIMSWKP